MAAKKHPGGRPTDYKDNMPDRVYMLTSEFGMTDKQLAKAFGVSEQTLNTWKKEHPEFLESLKRGKDDFDSDRVEKSLLKRALGYKFKEVTKESVLDPETLDKTLEVSKEVVKEVAPDPTSIIFWLKNRQSKRWRDAKNIDHGGGVTMRHISNVEEALIDDDDE